MAFRFNNRKNKRLKFHRIASAYSSHYQEDTFARI